MEETLTLTDLPDYCRRVITQIGRGSAVGLIGELGAGKTTFVRTLINELTPDAQTPIRVVSPSFVLHQTYPDLLIPVEHFDLYRLDNASERELDAIGYYDALLRTKERGGVLFVEWPERVSPMSQLELSQVITLTLGLNSRRLFRLKTVGEGEGGSKIIAGAAPVLEPA